MRKAVLATAAIALFVAIPATGVAAGGDIDTEVQILDGIEPKGGDQFIIVGNLVAPNKCQKFRPMQLVSDGNIIDEGPSSRRGTWALALEDKGEIGDTLRVRALRSNAGNDTCRADSANVFLR